MSVSRFGASSVKSFEKSVIGEACNLVTPPKIHCLLAGYDLSAHLEQRANRVGFAPVLNDFAISETVDIDARDGDFLIGRLQSEPRALMNATRGHARDHYVAVCELIFNRHLKIPVGRMDSKNMLAEAFNALWHVRAKVAVDRIFRYEIGQCFDFARVDNLFNISANSRLIIILAQCRLSASPK